MIFQPQMPLQKMSRTGSYFLARKVQQKLLRDASNPNINLRVIVTQTNMLCNLVSVIEGKKEVNVEVKEVKKEVKKEIKEEIIAEDPPSVNFELPSQSQASEVTSVTRELEYDSDDSDEIASDDLSEYGLYLDTESDSDVEDEYIEVLSCNMMLPNVQPPILTSLFQV